MLNDNCLAIGKLREIPEPSIVDDVCNVCGSISRVTMRRLLEASATARYIEPPTGQNVSEIEILGNRFKLCHLFDDPFSDDGYKADVELIETNCGNLVVYTKKIRRYQGL